MYVYQPFPKWVTDNCGKERMVSSQEELDAVMAVRPEVGTEDLPNYSKPEPEPELIDSGILPELDELMNYRHVPRAKRKK